MPKNKKIRLIIITILIILILLIGGILVVKSDGINKILGLFQKEEIKKEIRYEIYSLVDNKVKILVTAEDTENGLEKILYPNNSMELNCNGKNKVAIDYEIDVSQDATYTFVATNSLGEQITNTISINDDYRAQLNNIIQLTTTNESESQLAIKIDYSVDKPTKQYKIGDATNWTDYTEGFTLDSYQVQKVLGTSLTQVPITLREINAQGYIVQVEKEVNINPVQYNETDTVIEGESILACVENNTLQSGNYIFKVTGTTDGTTNETIEYPVELYNYDEDANYIASSNVKIENNLYTGVGNISSEKRMLILKYNGNLTIGENVTITPTGTKESINGATGLCTKKGMFIYCANTIENNGTISMTAKGTVNQVGENVYLFKNIDDSYEYVSAIGGAGGAGKSGRGNGSNGYAGKNRETGGGGSGSVHDYGKTQRGGNGTSYSGGTGSSGNAGEYGTSVASDYGGAGGSSYGRSKGGTGNPGGQYSGLTGTGGLLIIYTDNLKNNKNITAQGVNGASGGGNGDSGGASGGGSINIFCKDTLTEGNINANGGNAGSGYIYSSGAGGKGTVTTKTTILTKNENGQATMQASSLFDAIDKTQMGYTDYLYNIQEQQTQYLSDVILYNGDLTLDGTTQIDGATLSNNIYEFGNANTDVGTATENAKKTIILKVNGNLTINEGITLTSCKSASGYGGPKGFIIYCTGTITNNGTISMTARGAKAVGQNVYLFRNTDGSYEYVPAIGASGAAQSYGGTGINGSNGTGRQTGGGASGGTSASSGTGTSGAGARGTSYSGGTGGAGGNYTSTSGNRPGGAGGENGSNGGYATNVNVGGGAGNPGGSESGNNGTGGLLVIYSKTINNNGIIYSNGSNGGNRGTPGGSSGGGSINIFYKNQYTNTGTSQANGGERVSGTYSTGGAGGSGSVTVGSIATGTFVKDE